MEIRREQRPPTAEEWSPDKAHEVQWWDTRNNIDSKMGNLCRFLCAAWHPSMAIYNNHLDVGVEGREVFSQTDMIVDQYLPLAVEIHNWIVLRDSIINGTIKEETNTCL